MKEKDALEYLDSPSSVDATVLALSMAIAATATDVAKSLGIDLATTSIKLDVGQQSIRFRLRKP